MPVEKLLMCEPYGPQGITESQGAALFLDRGALGGAKHGWCRAFFGVEGDESENVPSTVQRAIESPLGFGN